MDAARVYVFFDYVCPYAYVGKHRADRLAREFGVEIVHLPWEIHPTASPAGEDLSGYPEASAQKAWLERLASEVGVEYRRPARSSNSNLALRGAEHAKDQGVETFEKYHVGVFDALWARGEDIGDERVLARIAQEAGMDAERFLGSIRHQAYQTRLDEVDRAATKLGIQRVPTFVFGDQRIVGDDPFDASLRKPLSAFLERRKALGPDHASTLEEDADLESLR